MKFTHLHTHSHYSLLQALPKIDELIDAAKDNGLESLALTDNGNLYGAIEFYKECKKGLELTWIRAFIRVIPEKASDRKQEADALKVFDNYVILHYDIDKKAFKEEDKDPILFGVISGSRKLYYIADWVDEYCNLTLEQFVDKFGEEAIKANDISVNFKLK